MWSIFLLLFCQRLKADNDAYLNMIQYDQIQGGVRFKCWRLKYSTKLSLTQLPQELRRLYHLADCWKILFLLDQLDWDNENIPVLLFLLDSKGSRKNIYDKLMHKIPKLEPEMYGLTLQTCFQNLKKTRQISHKYNYYLDQRIWLKGTWWTAALRLFVLLQRSTEAGYKKQTVPLLSPAAICVL